VPRLVKRVESKSGRPKTKLKIKKLIIKDNPYKKENPI